MISDAPFSLWIIHDIPSPGRGLIDDRGCVSLTLVFSIIFPLLSPYPLFFIPNSRGCLVIYHFTNGGVSVAPENTCKVVFHQLNRVCLPFLPFNKGGPVVHGQGDMIA